MGQQRKTTLDQNPRAKTESIGQLLDGRQPNAVEAEASLLGSVLIDPSVLNDVQLVINGANDFFNKANGLIFDVMVELYNKHSTVDLVQLQQLSSDRNILEAVGGVDYLLEVANSVPSAASATHYARLVKEKSVIRQLIAAAGGILQDAYSMPDEPQEVLNTAESRIFSIAQQSEQRHAESLEQLLNDAIEQIEKNEGRVITGVATGFTDLDEITSGFQPGEMIIVAARPSMGKTALALNIAENMVMSGTPVGMFSLEMSRQQLVQRLLSSRAAVSGHKLRRNMLSESDMQAIIRACDELMQSPFYIDDTPSLSIMQLRAKARRLKQSHDIGAVIIDYMQLMTSGKRAESRQQEVSEISRGIKALARELNVPVICLSQLNRAAEQREGHRPRLSDLRESGSIEQDADVVTMLHRETYYHINDPDWMAENEDKHSLAELIVAKQRNGPTAAIKLTWESKCTRFYDWTDASPPSDGSFAAVVPQGSSKDPFANDDFSDLTI
ncbi:MAG: replicative DNA helicase [Phycisphaerales bacterium]|jgi:replicative DNA helicase|nr:replicative DNA helicase [Phycisphaerales bacterium]MDP6692876.1 replicative DNA helicase [Phycisphaerales bacterium]